jgi:hypothetical protein
MTQFCDFNLGETSNLGSIGAVEIESVPFGRFAHAMGDAPLIEFHHRIPREENDKKRDSYDRERENEIFIQSEAPDKKFRCR